MVILCNSAPAEFSCTEGKPGIFDATRPWTCHRAASCSRHVQCGRRRTNCLPVACWWLASGCHRSQWQWRLAAELTNLWSPLCSCELRVGKRSDGLHLKMNASGNNWHLNPDSLYFLACWDREGVYVILSVLNGPMLSCVCVLGVMLDHKAASTTWIWHQFISSMISKQFQERGMDGWFDNNRFTARSSALGIPHLQQLAWSRSVPLLFTHSQMNMVKMCGSQNGMV